MGNRQKTAVPQNIKVFLQNQIEKKTSEPFFAYVNFEGDCNGVKVIRLSGQVKEVEIPAYIHCEHKARSTKRRLVYVMKYKAQVTSDVLIVRIEEWSFA